METCQQRNKRARRGRPPKAEQPQEEVYYRVGGAGTALARAQDEQGWFVLATTVGAEGGADPEVLQAYPAQNTTGEPGFRWIKNPAAITPVWLEKPERIAALAMLTVLGLLVYTVIQRQVRLYLRMHDQQVPGNKGETAMPTAAVVFALFSSVAFVQIQMRGQKAAHMYGVQPHHLLICDALGLNYAWYESPVAHKNGKRIHAP